jgi:hypothetical protein
MTPERRWTVMQSWPIGGECWLVVGAAPALSPTDMAVERLLRSLCKSVAVNTCSEWAVQPRARRFPRLQLAVLSSTCSDDWQPSNLASGGPALPLLVLGARGAWSALGLGLSEWDSGTAAVQIEAHEVAAPVLPGVVPLYERGGAATLTASLSCGGATSVARTLMHGTTVQGGGSVIVALERGSALCGSVPRSASARRVAVGLAQAESLSEPATWLLAGALLWLHNASAYTRGEVRERMHGARRQLDGSAEKTRTMFEYAAAREALARAALVRTAAAAGAADYDVTRMRAVYGAGGLGCHPSVRTAAATCTVPGTAPSATVLVHTFAGYRKFWAGFAANFARRWPHAAHCWPVQFATDEGDASAEVDVLRACSFSAHAAPTGRGAFSTRLVRALAALHTPLVLYLQEDIWLNEHADGAPGVAEVASGAAEAAGGIDAVLGCASALLLGHQLDGVRFEPPDAVRAGWYHLELTNLTCAGRAIYRFARHTNRWLFSHQPGLWRVEALRELAEPDEGAEHADENPWLNELLGSRRAAVRDAAVGLIVLPWFASVSSGGTLNAAGYEMLAGTRGARWREMDTGVTVTSAEEERKT